MSERQAAPHAVAFVVQCHLLLLQKRGLMQSVKEEEHHLAELTIGRHVLAEFEGHGLLKYRGGEAVAGLVVPEKRYVHVEDREFLFAILFVLELLHLNGHVSTGLGVAEREDCATSEEEDRELKRVNV